MASLRDLEKSEHDLIDVLFNLPPTELALRTKATDTLTKVRLLKAEFLRRNPSVLRKSGAAPQSPSRSPLINDAEVSQLVREATDRDAAERRLAKGITVYDARRDSAEAPLKAIKRELARPYREAPGLMTLLTKKGR